MADWLALQEALKNVGDAFEQRRKEKQAQDMAMQQIMLPIILKAQTEQQDPYKQAMSSLLNRMLSGQGTMSQPGQGMGQMGSLGDVMPELSLGPSGPSIAFRPSPQAEVKQSQEKSRATKLAEIEATMQPAKNILTTLKNRYFATFSDAPEVGKGLERFGYGLRKGYQAWTEQNPDIASYLQTRKAFLSMLVRGLGERGVLTNIDIQRVEKAIPSQYTTKSVAIRNFDSIEDILKSAIQRYGSQGGDISIVQDVFNSAGNTQPIQKQLDKNTAFRFLNQAKGNKNLARKLAQQAGYSF